MKKQLIVMAGLTAMFAACTNEDVLENFGTNDVAKTEGITFSIVDGVESRGDFKMDEATKKFMANWNAEKDEISVAYYGVKKGGTYAGGWNGVTETDERHAKTAITVTETDLTHSNSAVYKATKTAARGEFTAKQPSDLLEFHKVGTKNILASFRAYRGENISSLKYSKDDELVETMNLTVDVEATQSQTTGAKAPFDNFIMVSDTIGGICKLDYAVGESLPLSFERVFSGLALNTKGYNHDVYGNLKSITVETVNSNIVATGAVVDIAKKDEDGKWAIDLENATAGKTVTLTIGEGADGEKWSDDYYAFIQILPVDRSELSSAEEYTVTYTFATGAISYEKSSSKNWEANNFYTITADLANSNYTVLGTKLIVNKAMPTYDNSGKINGTAVAPATITEIISSVALSTTDLATLKEKYTGLTKLTLANDAASLGDNLANILNATTPQSIASLTLTKATTAPVITDNTKLSALTVLNCPEVTTIPAEAYKGNSVITSYSFPKVQTIGDDAFAETKVTKVGVGALGGENLIIGSYNATSKVKTSALTTVGENAFGDCEMVYIDAPALTTFNANPFNMQNDQLALTHVLLPAYDWTGESVMNFQLLGAMGHATITLEEVDFSGTTTIGGAVNVKNISTLKKVVLAANTAVKEGAFMGAGIAYTDNNTADDFEIVNINKITEVGKNAFNGAKIGGAIDFENTIAEIGEGAFASTYITSFDFTGVTTIGKNAFKGATKLGLAKVSSVETIEEGVFEGAGLSTVMLEAATTIKKNALAITGTTTIMLSKAVTLVDTPFGAMTGGNDGSTVAKAITETFSGITLYVNAEQEGVDGSKLTWKSGDKYYTATFASIIKL